jgi:hypothetical protein
MTISSPQRATRRAHGDPAAIAYIDVLSMTSRKSFKQLSGMPLEWISYSSAHRTHAFNRQPWH